MSDRKARVTVCWNCKGRPYSVGGWPLSSFEVGEVATDICHGGLGSVRILKHRRDGVTEYESLTTGVKRQLNSNANQFFVEETAVADALETLAKVSRVSATIARIARKEGLL